MICIMYVLIIYFCLLIVDVPWSALILHVGMENYDKTQFGRGTNQDAKVADIWPTLADHLIGVFYDHLFHFL